MTTTDRGSATLPAEPVGAVWRRVALQVNPFSYQGMRAPRGSFLAEEAYNQALVEECQRVGIDMIGITDHWRVDGSIGLIDAVEAAGIAALPGFEALSSEGIYVLVLFERGTPTGDVDAAIGACGGRPGCASGQPGKSFAEIVTCAVSRGALVIPAHVNGPDGVLTGLVSGAATITAWRNPEVHAVAVSPGRDVNAHQQQVLDNRDPEYERPHSVAVLYADDISDPARLGTPGGSCWVKMAVPSLAALQLAVRTPATRTSLVDPTVAGYPVIDAVAWQGGFLDGVALRFSPSLTCLIGGRGTGKSTVVESLRYGLGLEPIGASATRGYRQTVTSVLQPGTQVRITLRTGGGTFTVERTVPDPPTVRDAAGTLLASTPVDVLGSVEVFSQHELAELAESPDYVAELLRRFGAPTSPGRASVPTALRSNREALLAAARDLEAIDEQLADLPRQREALARFEAEGLDTRLAERAELDRQQIVLKTATERVSDVAATVEPLRDPGALDDAFARGRTAVATSDGGEGVDQRVTGVLARLRAELAAAAAAADTAVAGARRDLAELERDWSGRTAEARAGYEAALRALQDSGLDVQRYLAVRSAVQRLGPLTQQRPQLAGRLDALRAERQQLLAELADAAAADRARIATACRAAGAALQGVVRVQPIPSADRGAILALIESIRGQRTQIKQAVESADFSPRSLADAARSGPDALAERFDIRGAQATSLAAAGEALFLQLEELTVPSAAQASLNVATQGGSDFRPLHDLSQGQKATALLLLLLTASHGPLIIDQPEDDLDNRFIWEGVVPRLRELKNTRQLVLSTHNANIPVLGDAELVIALEAVGRKGRVIPDGAGSLDEAPVRHLAEQILEGGREAFDRRRYLYGF